MARRTWSVRLRRLRKRWGFINGRGELRSPFLARRPTPRATGRSSLLNCEVDELACRPCFLGELVRDVHLKDVASRAERSIQRYRAGYLPALRVRVPRKGEWRHSPGKAFLAGRKKTGLRLQLRPPLLID